jgi:uncharacterized phiE125 gp8 family phage protein
MIYYKLKQLAADNYILVTPATTPAIELSYIKTISKIDDDSYDSLLISLIAVVTEYGEKITGRDFINKTYKGFLDCFPACPSRSIQINKSKLQSISSIEYLKDNVLTTLDPSKYYFTQSSNSYSTINLIDGELWPTDSDRRKQAIIITFIAGYGDDSCDIPATLQRAMASHAELLRANSGDCQNADGINKQAKQLYNPFILATKLVCVI